MNGSGIGRTLYTFTSQMRISQQTPKQLTETSDLVSVIGTIKDFDAILTSAYNARRK